MEHNIDEITKNIAQWATVYDHCCKTIIFSHRAVLSNKLWHATDLSSKKQYLELIFAIADELFKIRYHWPAFYPRTPPLNGDFRYAWHGAISWPLRTTYSELVRSGPQPWNVGMSGTRPELGLDQPQRLVVGGFDIALVYRSRDEPVWITICNKYVTRMRRNKETALDLLSPVLRKIYLADQLENLIRVTRAAVFVGPEIQLRLKYLVICRLPTMLVRRVKKELKDLNGTGLPHMVVPRDFQWMEIRQVGEKVLCRVPFVMKGDCSSDYRGGFYMGCVELPEEYPFRPPDIYVFTRNGRFHIGKKICLSLTSFHKESWSPANTISTVLVSFQSFWYTEEKTFGAIRYENNTDEERRDRRKKLASASRSSTGSRIYKRLFKSKLLPDVRIQNNFN